MRRREEVGEIKECIYLIEQIDGSFDEFTEKLEVSIIQLGYTEDEQSAVKICDELSKKVKNEGKEYLVSDDTVPYPRFSIQGVPKLE